jgi:RHS repeat-associated protein
VRERSPGGTITRLVYNPRGWVLSKWIGTNDLGGNDSNPAGRNPWPAGANDMVKVEEYRYDRGNAGGDGNLTQLTQYVSVSGPPPVADTRVTSYAYDFRNRRTSQNGEVDFFEHSTFDNLDRIVLTQRRNTTSDGKLVTKSETLYDNRGHVYRTLRYGIDPEDGTGDIALADNTWRDASGNILKQQPAGARAFTRLEYDGIDRPVATYLAVNPAAHGGNPAGSVTEDTVIEQTETRYDAASNATAQWQRLRFHDASGTGPLRGPTGTEPRARVMHTVHFPDALGRMLATANYGSISWPGTNPPDTIPARSDTVLVTSTFYNPRGEAERSTDPADRAQKTIFDDAGRREEDIQNFVAKPDPDPDPKPDENKTTLFTYTPDGALATLAALNIVTGPQKTEWVYGTTLADSYIASTLLVRRKVYPDSPTDRVEFRYNRLGQVTEMRDQRDVNHGYDYDKLGRLLHDRVTSLGPTGVVDGTVRRISYTYEVRSLTATVGSYSSATPDQGTLRNEVVNTYNDFEQLELQHQDHGGGVAADVGYDYEDGQQNTIRQTKLIYPNGRKIEQRYEGAGGINDLMSRVSAIRDENATPAFVEYQYLGANTFVSVAYPEPTLELTYLKQGTELPTDGGDQYTGLDRFNRIIDQRWLKAATPNPVPVERLFYGYDALSNRKWRKNEVAPPGHDELYSYDGLNQIKSLKRGTLNEQHTTITSPTWQEDFSYDPTGNWAHYHTQTGQNPAFNQDRTHSQVNALTTLDNSTSLLASDSAGNMTRTPKPGNWIEAYNMVWDAWNRLTTASQTSAVAAYSYDGLSRRVTSGEGANESRQCYYTQAWQLIEERIGSTSMLYCEFLWGQQRLDDLVLRERNTSAGLERLYSIADPLNVVSIASADGVVVERLAYSAYGTPSVLLPGFQLYSSSSFSWETRFGNYRWVEGTGMYHVRHRILHSALGRWLSRDPVHERAGANLYRYCHNAPLSRTDPLGLLDVSDFFDPAHQEAVAESIADLVNPVDEIASAICALCKAGCVVTCNPPLIARKVACHVEYNFISQFLPPRDSDPHHLWNALNFRLQRCLARADALFDICLEDCYKGCPCCD